MFGNRVLQLGIHQQHDTLTRRGRRREVAVEPLIARRRRAAVGGRRRGGHELRGAEALDVRPFAGGVAARRRCRCAGPRCAASPSRRSRRGRPVVDAARTLCHGIHEQFEYDPSFTECRRRWPRCSRRGAACARTSPTSPIGALRMFGLAARYVSGYIETSPPPGGPAVGADASHAWCSVWVPALGWIDFDPTNDHLPADRHVTVAWGATTATSRRCAASSSARRRQQRLTVAVDVARL